MKFHNFTIYNVFVNHQVYYAAFFQQKSKQFAKKYWIFARIMSKHRLTVFFSFYSKVEFQQIFVE